MEEGINWDNKKPNSSTHPISDYVKNFYFNILCNSTQHYNEGRPDGSVGWSASSK